MFHFVGHATPDNDVKNFETICKVHTDCCISHKPHGSTPGKISYTVDIDKRLFSEELIVPTVTCFADIPELSLAVHVTKYGRFGLGFSRHFLTYKGARPVTYIPLRDDVFQGIFGCALLQDIEAVYKGFLALYETKITNTAKQMSRSLGVIPSTEEETLIGIKSVIEKDFLAFLKPFNSQLDASDPQNYYMEREWRKFANLQFSFNDVRKVYVAQGYKDSLARMFPALVSPIVEISDESREAMKLRGQE
jgi:hypothetical protein